MTDSCVASRRFFVLFQNYRNENPHDYLANRALASPLKVMDHKQRTIGWDAIARSSREKTIGVPYLAILLQSVCRATGTNLKRVCAARRHALAPCRRLQRLGSEGGNCVVCNDVILTRRAALVIGEVQMSPVLGVRNACAGEVPRHVG